MLTFAQHSASLSSWYINNRGLIRMACIIAGDFNKACLKTVLPKFNQHIKCATRGENTLDHVYSKIKHAYGATPSPTSDNQTTSLCSSSLPTPPLKGKQNQPPRPSKPGLKMLSTSCRTALPGQTGAFLKIRTWTHTHQVCPLLYQVLCR